MTNREYPQRVLVTGGSGFIGTNLVEFYEQRGVDVMNIDVAPPRNPALQASWRPLDILNAKKLQETISSFAPSVVIHLAARTDLRGRSLSDYDANTLGTQNVLSGVAASTTVERVLIASSRLVCRIGYSPAGDEDYCPTTAYGASKAVVEQMVRRTAATSTWVIVRPTSIWGPWFDAPYRGFFEAIARGHYVHIKNVDPLKSFGFVGNSIYQLNALATAPRGTVHSRTLYLADYEPVRIRELANKVQIAFSAPEIRTMPLWLIRGVAIAGDLLASVGSKRIPLTRFRLQNLVVDMLHELRPLEEIVGDLPYTVDEGVATTVAWMQRKAEIA